MQNTSPGRDSPAGSGGISTIAGVPSPYAQPPPSQAPSIPPPYPPYPAYPPVYPMPYPYAYPPPVRAPPRPRGPPKRSWFVLGAVGQFFAAGAALALEVTKILHFDIYLDGNLLTLAASVVLSVALLVQLAGFYGLRWNYGMALGVAAVVVGLLASSFFLLTTALTPFAHEEFCDWGWCWTRMATWGVVLNIVAFVLLGAAFIVQGAVCVVARRFTGLPGAAVAAGVLCIVGGSLLCSFLMAFLGALLVLVPGFIIYGIVLLHAPLPLYAWPPATAYSAGAP